MADISGAELTLRTTPTAGVSGEHSPYYRRLLSSGYKGFLQGTIGGATFYGLIGAVIGTIIAVPLMLTPASALIGLGLSAHLASAIATTAWALIPMTSALGMVKGATTFGQIGSMAAINAESAEMSERRRYLLDRYYALPNDKAYDAEAEQIQKMLATQHETHAPGGMFHWKTVAICALLGAAVCGGFIAFAPAALVGELHLATWLGTLGIMQGTVAATGVGALIGTALGALAGSVIGLDRYYVRKWFDHTENLVNDPSGNRVEMAIRERELKRLEEVSPDRNANMQAIKLEVRGPKKADGSETLAPLTETNADKPATRVDSVHLDARLANVNLDRSLI